MHNVVAVVPVSDAFSEFLPRLIAAAGAEHVCVAVPAEIGESLSLRAALVCAGGREQPSPQQATRRLEAGRAVPAWRFPYSCCPRRMRARMTYRAPVASRVTPYSAPPRITGGGVRSNPPGKGTRPW